jgi:hydroxymethylpyrimidine pyrophosphatase-like HAD family hydrolase
MLKWTTLATDYDGTLATLGRVAPETRAALGRAQALGVRLVLVTGRVFQDLRRIFPGVEDIFDAVVAENGALLYTARPPPARERALAAPLPPAFADALRARGVPTATDGAVIVSTKTQHRDAVERTIRDMALDVAVILNKTSLMVLPRGVDKGSGLRAALEELGIDPRQAVSVGDAENDEPLFTACGLSVAVANALPELKRKADVVTTEAAGAGVVELVDGWLALPSLPSK